MNRKFNHRRCKYTKRPYSKSTKKGFTSRRVLRSNKRLIQYGKKTEQDVYFDLIAEKQLKKNRILSGSERQKIKNDLLKKWY